MPFRRQTRLDLGRAATEEAYLEGQVRILTRLEDGKHYLIFAGNHDQVRQFLKEN